MSSEFWKPWSSTPSSFLDGGAGGYGAPAAVFPQPSAPHLQPRRRQRQQHLLPISRHKKQILYALEHFEVLVIVGETGCGKSTQLPQYLWEGGWASNGFNIAVAQSRSNAARVLAERVSEECGERIPVRSTVPFRDSQLHHHGGGGRSSKDDPNPFSVDGGAIHFVTYDVLLDAVKQDPLLSRYSVIVADDAHERALHGDLALGLLRQIQSSKKRSDLRVVVCSAGAVAAQALLQFFESKPSLSDQASSRNNMNRCCAISVDGQSQQTSPAAVVDVLHITNPTPNYLQGTLETCARILKAEDSMAAGHVLCFLPTRQAVDDAIRMASEQDGTWFPHQSVDLLPLYYDVNSLPSSSHRQLQALDFSKKRTIVFATSVAETSITIPGIRHVVDSGLTHRHYFDPNTGLNRQMTAEITHEEASQRASRVAATAESAVAATGRDQPSGKVYRLYTEAYFAKMDMHPPPEISRSNLTGFLLTLKAVGVDNVLGFDMVTVPPVALISHGLETLYALGALDERTRLTPLGRRLSCFPYGVDPRIAAMLLKSLELECSWDALGAASALALVLGGDGGDRRSGSSAGMSSSSLLWQPPPSAHHHQRFLDYQTSVSDLLDPSGDHATYLNVLAEFEQRGWNERDCRERYLNFHALKRCREIRRHLASVLRGFGALSPSILDENQRSALVLQCVCAGFFFNVAKLGSDGRYYTLRRHIAVSPAPGSALSVSAAKATPRRGGSSWSSPKSQYIVFGASADGPRGGMELIAVSSVEARWLREAAPHYWDS